MARGDTPQLDGEPDGGPANQREILAQFEAAIAGMRTRDIQIGLRRLLAATVPPPHSPGSREADSAGPAADSAAGPLSTIGPGGSHGGAQANGDQGSGERGQQ